MNSDVRILLLWLALTALGLFAVGSRRDYARNPPTISPLPPTAVKECYFVRTMPVRLRGDRDPYFVEWNLCREREGFTENYVTLENGDQKMYAFDAAEIVDRLDRLDLDRDGNEELLFVGMAGGTGNNIDWCVLGWDGAKLSCWQVPPLNFPSEKLLKPDEDFCCKDWRLKVRNEKLVLGRGIYRKGDGNCCPSRGGAFVELSPDHGKFLLTKVWRSDIKTYEAFEVSR